MLEVLVRETEAPIESPRPIVGNSTASSACLPTRVCTTWARRAWVRETSVSVVTRASVVAERVSVRAALGDRPVVWACDLVPAPDARAWARVVSADQPAVWAFCPVLERVAPGDRRAVWVCYLVPAPDARASDSVA